MNKKRKILFRAGAVAILLVIAGAMFIVGRGHTVYLDNKKIEYGGQTYDTPYKVVAYDNGEQFAKLYDKERGMTTCIGQKFSMYLEITKTKGGDEETRSISFSLPYNMDGVVINLPALLAGLPEEAYLTKFVSAPVVEAVDEEIVTDEFELPEVEAEAE